MARLGSAAIVALLLVSCLFPSIDALEGDGTTASGDGGPADDGAAKREIACSDRNCQLPFQVCCAGSKVSCIGDGEDSPCDGTRIACDGDEDCAGGSQGMCCLVDDKTIACRAECETPVCTRDPARCQSGKSCKEIASAAGHKACQD